MVFVSTTTIPSLYNWMQYMGALGRDDHHPQTTTDDRTIRRPETRPHRPLTGPCTLRSRRKHSPSSFFRLPKAAPLVFCSSPASGPPSEQWRPSFQSCARQNQSATTMDAICSLPAPAHAAPAPLLILLPKGFAGGTRNHRAGTKQPRRRDHHGLSPSRFP